MKDQLIGDTNSPELPTEQENEGQSAYDNEIYLGEDPDEPHPFLFRLDRYLRREDTFLANACRRISSDRGQEYIDSNVKRYLDLSVAIPAYVVSSPLGVFIGIAIAVDDRGNMIFVQERVGKGGETFDLIKFRSMVEGADEDPLRHEKNSDPDPEDDDRATRVGAFIRRYDLDEILQFGQVIDGTLSMVDLRPLTEDLLPMLREEWGDEAFEEWYSRYLRAADGLTGLNQVINPDHKDSRTRRRLDIFYFDNASLGLDLYIMWRTFLKMTRLKPWTRRRRAKYKETRRRLKEKQRARLANGVE